MPGPTARSWRRPTPRPGLAGRAVPAPPDPDRVALVDALRRLPEEQRRAIVLHHLADLPVGTVKARLSRGRAALALLLDEQDELAEGAGHA